MDEFFVFVKPLGCLFNFSFNLTCIFLVLNTMKLLHRWLVALLLFGWFSIPGMASVDTLRGTYDAYISSADTLIIAGNVTVNDLNIAAGTRVMYQGNYTLSAYEMYAVGAINDSIHFTVYPGDSDTVNCRLLTSINRGYPCGVYSACPIGNAGYCTFTGLTEVTLHAYDSRFSNCQILNVSTIDNCSFLDNDSLAIYDYIQNSTVKNTQQFQLYPIAHGRGGAFMFIYNCLFENNHATLHSGATGTTIANNLFRNNTATPVLIDYGYLHSSSIRNNVFYNNRSATGAGAVQVNGASNVWDLMIFNNTFYANEGTSAHSVHLETANSKRFYNNIFWSASENALPEVKIDTCWDTYTNYQVFENNLVYGGVGRVELAFGYSMDSTAVYNFNPHFVDSIDGKNLQLSFRSEAIDAGFDSVYSHPPPLNMLTYNDLSGNSRVFGRHVDLGAYEYYPQHNLQFTYVTPDTGICENDSVMLKAFSLDRFMYSWYRNGELLEATLGDTCLIPLVSDADTGSYQVCISDGDTTHCSDPFRVAYVPVPVIAEQPGSIGVCAGDSLVLSINVLSNVPVDITWHSLSGLSSFANGTEWVVPEVLHSDSLFAQLNYQCGTVLSDTAIVNVYPLPEPNLGVDTALAYSESITLNPGSFAEVLWSTGETTSEITLDSSQMVWVQVANAWGCSGSDTVLVSKNPNLLQSSYSENGFAAYPNPVHGSLYLTVPNGTPVPCPVKLYSAAGVLIDHFLLMHTGTNAVESVSHCDPGVYYLEIAAGELRHSTQIVVY